MHRGRGGGGSRSHLRITNQVAKDRFLGPSLGGAIFGELLACQCGVHLDARLCSTTLALSFLCRCYFRDPENVHNRVGLWTSCGKLELGTARPRGVSSHAHVDDFSLAANSDPVEHIQPG